MSQKSLLRELYQPAGIPFVSSQMGEKWLSCSKAEPKDKRPGEEEKGARDQEMLTEQPRPSEDPVFLH